MQDLDPDHQTSPLDFLNLKSTGEIYFNLSTAELVEQALTRKEGHLSSTGALMVNTGKFTGRSPRDRFIVKDQLTRETVWWGPNNLPFEEEKFDRLMEKMNYFLSDKDLFVRDAYVAADPAHRLGIRTINTLAWHNLFCHTMFLRPTQEELKDFRHNFTVICVPEFEADPEADGTASPNFVILNLSKRIILIGGTGYSGEIKKGIFSALNFILPHEKNVLSMHCSANIGQNNDTAIFFGLSGTGKTTLSTDPNRRLIGDDEHGWTDTGVFNFEGGCYAKVIDLSPENEPEIWGAIRFGALVENTRFNHGSRTVNYQDSSLTENTRTAYPVHFIPNAVTPSLGGIPKNIFFLTADAFGVIPPISRLGKSQAMYHFISGYTAKVAGTEMGITEPKLTFSSCFGVAFLPLHPANYATILGEKIEQYQTNVWLINTGWTGGPYGIGSRIKLAYTRAMITAALKGELEGVDYRTHAVFGMQIPQSCPDVPTTLLNPEDTWEECSAYFRQAEELGRAFIDNFRQFESMASPEILWGAPRISELWSAR